MPSKKLYAFVIDDDLRAGLKRVKKRDGIGESEQIRRALRTWLERQGAVDKTRPSQASRSHSRAKSK
jgi:hypothetical protein